MRVEPADQNSRIGQTELVAQILVQNAQDGCQFLLGDRRRYIGQWEMRRRQRHAQRAMRCIAGQHHDDAWRCCLFGEVLGMPGKGAAGVVNDAFM